MLVRRFGSDEPAIPTASPLAQRRIVLRVDCGQPAGDLVINPLLGLWLNSANAWMGVASKTPLAEMQRQQSRTILEAGEQVIRFWSGAWMLSASDKDRPVAERMAARSLRVVQGGRR
jgi:hypothetical protein